MDVCNKLASFFFSPLFTCLNVVVGLCIHPRLLLFLLFVFFFCFFFFFFFTYDLFCVMNMYVFNLSCLLSALFTCLSVVTGLCVISYLLLLFFCFFFCFYYYYYYYYYYYFLFCFFFFFFVCDLLCVMDMYVLNLPCFVSALFTCRNVAVCV